MSVITCVALLRGVNVGRAKRIAMADLRALVGGLGFGDVRTVLNSGNVVFTVPADHPGSPAALIEAALEERLGIASRVTLLTAGELAAVVAGNPLTGVATDPSRLLVAISPDLSRLAPLLNRDWSAEALAAGPHAAYLWCPAGILASALAAAVNRQLGDAVTMRNWSTITRLAALACG